MGCRPFRLDMWDFRAISLHGLLGARPGRHERRRRLLACRGAQPSGPCDATDCSVLAPRPRSANAAGIQRAWGVIGWCFGVSSLTSILRSGEKRWRGGNRKEGGALWILEGFHLLQFLSLFLVDLFHNRDPPTTVLRRCLLSTTRRAAQQAGFCSFALKRHHGLPRTSTRAGRAGRAGNCSGMSHPHPD